MVRCIVKSCTNNSAQFHKDHVSFLKLPSNDVVLDDWFQKIGEVKFPPKADTARICSIHFTEDSFVQAKTEISSGQKRFLRPTAVPTLHLDPIKNRTRETSDFRNIKRKFPGAIHERNNSEDEKDEVSSCSDSQFETVTEPDSPSSNFEFDATNIRSTISKILSERGDQKSNSNIKASFFYVDTRKKPEGDESNVVKEDDADLNNIESQFETVTETDTSSSSNAPDKSLNKKKRPSKRLSVHNDSFESESDEDSPERKRKARFLEVWVDKKDQNFKKMKTDDLHIEVEWLQSEVQYFRTLSKFHETANRIKRNECRNLKTQMKSKTEEINNLLAENKKLQSLVRDLETKLNAVKKEQMTKEILKKKSSLHSYPKGANSSPSGNTIRSHKY